MRTMKVNIAEGQDGRTVKSILQRELLVSDSLLARLKLRPDGILLNGVKAYVTATVHTGDLLQVQVGDLPGPVRSAPMQIPLSILFEDEDLLILDKPAGLPVHADSRRPEEPTLENALLAYLGERTIPHPVSRLDRGTSGVITYAKSGWMHEILRQRLHTSQFQKEYLGIAEGIPQPPAGRIALPLGFAPGSTYQRAVTPNGQPAETEYETAAVLGQMALIRLIPHTGRTHQLRVHMAAVGCPLLGDWLYGRKAPGRMERPALHSYQLMLTHPLTGERLTITAPLPEDFRRVMEGLPTTLQT